MAAHCVLQSKKPVSPSHSSRTRGAPRKPRLRGATAAGAHAHVPVRRSLSSQSVLSPREVLSYRCPRTAETPPPSPPLSALGREYAHLRPRPGTSCMSSTMRGCAFLALGAEVWGQHLPHQGPSPLPEELKQQRRCGAAPKIRGRVRRRGERRSALPAAPARAHSRRRRAQRAASRARCGTWTRTWLLGLEVCFKLRGGDRSRKGRRKDRRRQIPVEVGGSVGSTPAR